MSPIVSASQLNPASASVHHSGDKQWVAAKTNAFSECVFLAKGSRRSALRVVWLAPSAADLFLKWDFH